MEKILTNSEKIRRAEEIYAKRKGLECNKFEDEFKTFNIYKFIFKLFLTINIALLIVIFQNRNFIFSTVFLEKVEQYTENINKFVNSYISELKENEFEIDRNVYETTDEKISKLDDFSPEIEEKVENEKTIYEKIKENYSFIKPIDGIVTSLFGQRESEYQNVRGYHKGIDIGAKQGSKIKSAIDGTVTQVSSEGDYRKSFES